MIDQIPVVIAAGFSLVGVMIGAGLQYFSGGLSKPGDSSRFNEAKHMWTLSVQWRQSLRTDGRKRALRW